MSGYGSPADPVSGTVISVAYAIANLLDPIRQLRTNTGGADPSASNTTVYATAPGVTTWGRLPFDAIADATIADTAVPSSDTGTVALTLSELANRIKAATGAAGWKSDPVASLAALNTAVGTAQSTANTAITNAATADTHAGTAQSRADSAFTNAGNAQTTANTGVTNAATAQTRADAAFARTPAGLVAAFTTAAAIAAGWSRFTQGDGRIMIGAGATFTQTFTEGASYGDRWTPSSNLTIANTLETTVGGVAAPNTGNDHSSGAGTGTASGVHTHPAPSVSITGGISINNTSAAWFPAMYCLVWAQKVM